MAKDWNTTTNNEMELSLSSPEVYNKIYSSEETFEVFTELSFNPNDEENNEIYENFLEEASENVDTDVSTVKVKGKKKVNERDLKLKCLMIALLPKKSVKEIDGYLLSSGHTAPKVSKDFVNEVKDYRKEKRSSHKALQLVAEKDAVILSMPTSSKQDIQDTVVIAFKNNGQASWLI